MNLFTRAGFYLRMAYYTLKQRGFYLGYLPYLVRQVFGKRFFRRHLVGEEKASGDTLRVRYLGEGRSLDYLKTVLFRSPPTESTEERYSLVQILLGVEPVMDGCDLHVREYTPRIMKLLRPTSDFTIPDWVEQDIDLSGSWDDVVSRFRKNTRTTDLRKVRKYGFTHDIVNDRASLEHFYDYLYAPYLTRRFGDAVDLVDRDWLIAVGENGGLMRILDGERVIAGVVFHHGDDYLDWLWTGALSGDDADLEDGASSALYFYSIKYAYDRGFRRVTMNKSRPFLNDGLHRYKRKWGAHVAASRHCATKLLLDLDPTSQVARRWLAASPFFTERDDGLYVNVFCFDGPPDTETLTRNVRNLVSPGTNGIDVHLPKPAPNLPPSIDSCAVHYVAFAPPLERKPAAG